MNRLWVRLVLAFAVVVLVAVGAVALLAGLTARQEFSRYLTYGDVWPTQAMVDRLAEYYRAQGSWRGVETILGRGESSPDPWVGSRHEPAPGPLQVILSDADGHVIYDRPDAAAGRLLTTDEQAAARAIEVDGKTVGLLVIVAPRRPDFAGPLEQWFVGRLQWWLIVGAVLAGALGVLLGAVLSRNLTAPLQRLAEAARAVATRDFSRQVKEEGGREVADVARAFNQMTVALAESERQRQNMVADVAHELRTPLTVLQGNLQAILDDVYPLDKAEIARLFEETRLLNRLVDDLRELALADAGQLRLNLQPVEFLQVAAGTLDSMALLAEEQEVELVVQTPSDLPAVQADPDRLAQVLRNLLVNALRHTPAGGSVALGAKNVGDAVEITVTDTGEGISPEDLPHIFERFWRTDPARTRDRRWAGSAGLGLAVAQSLVEAQGGRIWAESVLGQGSTFHFTLPLATPTD